MWTVVYMTQDEKTATTVGNIFEQKGLIYIVRPIGNKNEDCSCFEILVPETEINEAHNIIIENNLM